MTRTKSFSLMVVFIILTALFAFQATPALAGKPERQHIEWDETYGCVRYVGENDYTLTKNIKKNSVVTSHYRSTGWSRTEDVCTGELLFEANWRTNVILVYNGTTNIYEKVFIHNNTKGTQTVRYIYLWDNGRWKVFQVWVDGEKVY